MSSPKAVVAQQPPPSSSRRHKFAVDELPRIAIQPSSSSRNQTCSETLELPCRRLPCSHHAQLQVTINLDRFPRAREPSLCCRRNDHHSASTMRHHLHWITAFVQPWKHPHHLREAPLLHHRAAIIIRQGRHHQKPNPHHGCRDSTIFAFSPRHLVAP
ncbi:hypothetical protein V8G54_034399 [Vigna mungo]|uniref:Uncharacterized protein n=1 Tax=Vigna mungo TaxID=3915 RepID=A0AAQ3MQK5_VIGMU